jgi:uncharacterized membrane protein YgcG
MCRYPKLLLMTFRLTVLASLLASLLGGAASARAASGVRDAGNFFTPNAISRANDIIYDIHARLGKDLLIETFPTIPDDLKSHYDPQEKPRFFSQWAHQRFAQEKLNGIFILVCRDPTYLQIIVGDQTADVFRPANQQEMRQALLSAFHERNFDQGLTDAAEYVRSTLTRNMAGPAQTALPNTPIGAAPGGLGCFGIVLVMVAVFIVLRLLVTILGSGPRSGPSGTNPPGSGPPGPGYAGGYGGPFGYGGGPLGYGSGGFGRGMLGGLLGGLAGNWPYDRMFRGPADYYGPPSGGEFGAPPGPGAGNDPNNDRGQGMDAGGGDYSAPTDSGSTGVDDSSGGADSGGGDFGGGGDSGGSF